MPSSQSSAAESHKTFFKHISLGAKCVLGIMTKDFQRRLALYFLILSCIFFIPLYAIPLKDGTRIRPVDAYTTTISGLTNTGLNPINMSSFTFGHLFILCITMALGYLPFILWLKLFKSLFAFWKTFSVAEKAQKAQQYQAFVDSLFSPFQRCARWIGQIATRRLRRNTTSRLTLASLHENPGQSMEMTVLTGESPRKNSTPRELVENTATDSTAPPADVEPRILQEAAGPPRTRSITFAPDTNGSSRPDQAEETPKGFKLVSEYLPGEVGLVTPNSEFFHMNPAGRKRLRSLQFDAYVLLIVVQMVYFVLALLSGILFCGNYIANNRPDIAKQLGMNPWWMGTFLTVSALTNTGMSPSDTSLIMMADDIPLQLAMIALMLLGLSFYPPALRLLLFALHHFAKWRLKKNDSPYWRRACQTTKYVLGAPRRSYLYLFPTLESCYLMLILVILYAFDFGCLYGINRDDATLSDMSLSQRVFNMFLQAVAVRGTGFVIIGLASLKTSYLFIAAFQMLIGPIPLATIVRNTNIFERRNLHRWDVQKKSRVSRYILRHCGSNFFGAQLSELIASDLIKFFGAAILIALVNHDHMNDNNIGSFVWEVMSAFANNGMSLGVKNDNYSFVGSLNIGSKLIICAVMLAGKLRPLPYGHDYGLEEATDVLDHAEEQDGTIIEEMRRFSFATEDENEPDVEAGPQTRGQGVVDEFFHGARA